MTDAGNTFTKTSFRYDGPEPEDLTEGFRSILPAFRANKRIVDLSSITRRNRFRRCRPRNLEQFHTYEVTEFTGLHTTT